MAPADDSKEGEPAGPLPDGPGDDEGAGARKAFDEVFSASYEELRRLAATVRRHEVASTLSPTALVHEAWLKLRGSPALAGTSPLHFRRIAARAMRQVLVEAGRRRRALKRGGADAVVVTYDDDVLAEAPWSDDVLALDAALEALALNDARQARLVECRYFAGLSVAEAAEALGISEATALRDWRAARAWLALEMRRES
ncbi:MAG: sigma-70 family RNA polymerase sigma factor [Candidatus Eisenbacteria bacterium]|nr:sigma-70 family RNA polymerase sigma factor [Candidatus Eisenbacteria bacterium]